MKTISLITRRDDMTRDEFRDYYEQQHAELAMRYFPYQRYTRNHVLGDAVPGFDCISEFDMTDAFRANAGNVMESESRARLLADELKFMRPECIRVALVEELMLKPARAGSLALSKGGVRSALLYDAAHSADIDLDKIQTQLLPLLTGAACLKSASLDIVRHRADSLFPFDAVLWLNFDGESCSEALLAQLRQQDGLRHEMEVATFATPLPELQDRFEAYLP